MKIGQKLFLMIITVNLIGTISFAGIVLYLNHKRTTNLVYNEIKTTSAEHTLIIKTWLESHLDATITFGQVMERYEQIENNQRRFLFNLMIQSSVESNNEVLGACTIWEPNELDGLDAEYAGVIGSDDQGRFVPIGQKQAQV